MFSQFAFVLKIRIKRAFPLLVHMRFLFSLSSPEDILTNPTLWDFCVSMIGRADIEGSKSNVAMNAWLPPASYPCGNFSDISSWTFFRPKGSIGHVFTVCIRTENQNQARFSPCGPHEIPVLIELTFGHLRYHLTDVPPQPHSPPDYVFRTDQPSKETTLNPNLAVVQVSV